MKRTSLLVTALALPFALAAQNSYNSAQEAAKAVTVKVDTSREPIQKGKYKPLGSRSPTMNAPLGSVMPSSVSGTLGATMPARIR